MASDVRFASGGNALKIPFRLSIATFTLRVAVNGSAPLWLVLDTGAPNIIATKSAGAGAEAHAVGAGSRKWREDSDVLEWFRKRGRGLQTKTNSLVSRIWMLTTETLPNTLARSHRLNSFPYR